MKFIKPWIEVEKIDGIKIMKNLELAAKQCYRSQDNIKDESYDKFLRGCISRGHESVIEHEKVSIRMCCDIGVYKDLTRHRLASFSIESTRYCNYSKDKFDNNISFIVPCNIEEGTQEYKLWQNCMSEIEQNYNAMAELGCKPDQLRLLLPHSTAAEVVMTANIREWRHILSLRADSHAHPSIQQLMIPLLLYFQKEMPALFDDISYNTSFPEEKYANLKLKG